MVKKRLLTAIMFTDIVGYSAAMSRDERVALNLLHRSRELVRLRVRRYGGRLLDTTGDATLSTFASAIDAVNCALAIQNTLMSDSELSLRIGLHVGDVVRGGDRIYGDGVNVAARLQSIAPDGGIVASDSIYNAVYNHEEIHSEALGEKNLKNIGHPIPAYLLTGEPVETPVLPILENKRLQRMALIAFIALAIPAAILIYSLYPASDTRAGPNTVAVLPFMNISGDSSTDYFTDGLTEELISALTRVEGLKVASTTSAFSFKENPVEVTTIAKRLRVQSVLEGSVRKSGDRIRINVKLVDGDRGYQQWSQVYDRTLEDIFVIQEEIARAVASQMEVAITSETEEEFSRRLTTDLTAYDYYLQGRSYLRRPKDRETLEGAESLFRQALTIDPEYVRAKLGLCDAVLAQFVLLKAPSIADRATPICEEAVKADPSLAEAHASVGELYRNKGQYANAESEFRRAIEINSRNMQAYEGLGRSLNAQGREEEAEQVFKRAVAVEPGYWGAHKALGNFYYRNDRFSEAARAYQNVVGLSPGNAPGYNNLAAAYYMLGDFSGAADAWARSLNINPSRSAYLNTGNMYYFTGRYGEAVEMFQKALVLAPEDYRIWGSLGDSYWYIEGGREKALEAYRKAAELAGETLVLNPRDGDAARHLALFEARLGDPDRAKQLIERALEDPSKDSDTYLYAARVNIGLGRRDEAIAMLQEAMKAGHLTHLVAAEPDFDVLKSDTRFQALLESYRET